jgi:phage protein D
MSAQPASLLPYGIVRLGGTEIDSELAAAVVMVRVRENLRLPDQAHLRVGDPRLLYVDDERFAVGKTVEVLYGAPGASAATSVFSGPIESIELDFAGAGAFIAVTAYEPAFALHRACRTQIFQNMTSSDIARKVIRAAGLTAALSDTSASTIVHPFLLQAEETDWQLLWRLADAIDYEIVGEGRTVHFRPAGSAPASAPIELRAPGNLTRFRPRVSAAQQVSSVQVRGWDPAKAEAIAASEEPPAGDSSPGIARSEVAAAADAGEWMLAGHTVLGHEEAGALAESVAARRANAWVQADGVARGDPRLRAGCHVQVDGVGARFGGAYTLTSVTHLLRGGRGYETHFSISGHEPNTLVSMLDTGAAATPWGASVVVGVVTQTDDPEGLGRVRVSYPALGENAEGWWARIATPAAGAERGLLMMPMAGDEVVLAFEQGDPRRAYVLGAVWNGAAKPGELVKRDGSFSLASDRDIALNASQQLALGAEQGLSLQGSKSVSVESERELELAGGSSVTIKADGSVTVQAGGAVTLKGQSIALEASTVRISGTVSFL